MLIYYYEIEYRLLILILSIYYYFIIFLKIKTLLNLFKIKIHSKNIQKQ